MDDSLSSAGRLSPGSVFIFCQVKWFAVREFSGPLGTEGFCQPQRGSGLSVNNPQTDHEISIIVKVNSDFFEQSVAQGGSNRNALKLISAYRSQLTGAQIRLLLDSPLVEYVTIDVPIRTSSDEFAPSGLDQFDLNDGFDLESQNPFLATIGAGPVAARGYTGAGVAVAVFDSGIGEHPDLDQSRILAAVDFTSGDSVISSNGSDNYGHGTAVAGIIGGTGKGSAGAFPGVAPAVDFVDVKVVGDDGSGLTSNLIQAIDWVITHKDQYNIRIANLSIGHPPI